MKKALMMATIGSILLFAGNAVGQDVKVKKGKATMSEEYYNELRQKAEAYDQLKNDNANLSSLLQSATAPARMQSFGDSASYAIGRDVYKQWASQNLGINGTMAGEAMRDCAQGRDRFTDQMARPLLERFQEEFENRQNAGLKQTLDEGEKFMAEMAKSKSVYSTASGLKYRKIKAGNGKKPKATDKVKVHYTGKLIDGTVFDSSVERGAPMTFPLNQVIAGWTEGLQLMDEGSKYILYVPPRLGYGNRATGNIPAGSTLIFEVELLEINPK